MNPLDEYRKKGSVKDKKAVTDLFYGDEALKLRDDVYEFFRTNPDFM